MRIRPIVSSIAFAFLLAAGLFFATPAFAAGGSVEDNPAGHVVDVVSNGQIMNSNYGMVRTNQGQITHNVAGAVIENNFSIVRKNDGVIVNNFSTNTNLDEGSGTIRNNYFVRPAESGTGWENPELWGTENNFYRVSNRSATFAALDWSLNPAALSVSPYVYVGAPDNKDESLRGATFKAAEGYGVALKATDGDGFTVTDNGDGTFTVAVDPGCRKTELDLESVLDIQRLVGVSVTADPAEGGTIVHRGSDDAFVSGRFPMFTRFSLDAKPNDGYRFVGWDVPADDNRVHITDEGALEINALWDEFVYDDPIVCTALFEKIAVSDGGQAGSTVEPEDGTANGGASAGGEGGSASSSATALAQTGDNTGVLIALFSLVTIAVGALGVVAARKCI